MVSSRVKSKSAACPSNKITIKVIAQNPVIQDSLASPAAGFDIFYLLYSAADSIKSIIKSK